MELGRKTKESELFYARNACSDKKKIMRISIVNHMLDGKEQFES